MGLCIFLSNTPLIYYLPFQDGASFVVPKCYNVRVYMISSNMITRITPAHYASCLVLFCNLK